MTSSRVPALPGGLLEQIDELWRRQREHWPMLRAGADDLATVRVRECRLADRCVRIQCNPRRIRSASAKVDPASLAARPCFLCPKNLPEQQQAVAFRESWWVLCNPAPIFEPHFVIASRRHEPQRIDAGLDAILDLARAAAGRLTVFYNGPGAGASAPDHLHLQAIPAGVLPLDAQMARWSAESETCATDELTWIKREPTSVGMVSMPSLRAAVFVADDAAEIRNVVSMALADLRRVLPAGSEPPINLFAVLNHEALCVLLVPRRAHRAESFGDGEEQFLVSPGAIDIGGVLITPREIDYHRLSPLDIAAIYEDVLITTEQQDAWRNRLERRFSGA
ncbi:MAG: DUF4922 domain-containing protein [Planctomycetota bacterium]|nr:MAG: DUF4922 domain-containing protein [Planctomycetota bacterium]